MARHRANKQKERTLKASKQKIAALPGGPMAVVQCEHWQGRPWVIRTPREIRYDEISQALRGTYAATLSYTRTRLSLLRFKPCAHTLCTTCSVKVTSNTRRRDFVAFFTSW